MLHHFLRNALLVVVLNLGVKGIYLLLVEREVQNILPEGDYGLYFSLLSLAILLQIVLDFGLQLYNSRHLAGNRAVLAKYFPHYLGVKLALGLVYFSVLGSLGFLLGYEAAALRLLLLIGLNQWLLSMLLFLRSNLTGTGRYRADSWVSVLDKALLLVLVGGLLHFARDELTVVRFTLAQTVCWASSVVVVSILLGGGELCFRPIWNGRIMRVLLRRAAPFALAVFLMTAYTRTDAVMIERLLPDGRLAADHYAAAYRLLDAVNMLGYLLSGLLLPMFARLLSQNQSVAPLLRMSLLTVLAGSLCVVLPVMVYAPRIVHWLYDFAEWRTGMILHLLIFSFVAMCVGYVYGALLGAADRLRDMNRLFVWGCVLNVVGNLLVLPRYGAIGAAAVTTLTQSGIALGQVGIAHRAGLGQGLDFPRGRFTGFAIGLGGLCYFVSQNTEVSWSLAFVIILLGGLLLAFLTRLLDLREWWGLLLNRNHTSEGNHTSEEPSH